MSASRDYPETCASYRAIFNYFFTVTAPPLPRPDVYSTLCQRSQWGEEITRLRVSTGGSTSHAQQTSGAHKHDGRDEQPVGMNSAAVSNANTQIFILPTVHEVAVRPSTLQRKARVLNKLDGECAHFRRVCVTQSTTTAAFRGSAVPPTRCGWARRTDQMSTKKPLQIVEGNGLAVLLSVHNFITTKGGAAGPQHHIHFSFPYMKLQLLFACRTVPYLLRK